MNGAGPGGGAAPQGYGLPCPFCGTPAVPPQCMTCGRDPRAPRRICTHCHRQTPIAEALCLHCRRAGSSEMAWKVPVIILMFVVAFAISIAIASAR